MFKPNIRGFPKAQLSFTLFGWRLREKPGSMILHRFPWRGSWVKQLGRNPEGQPVLSRSGRTHLVVEVKERPERTIPKFLFIAIALSTLSAIFLIAQAEPESKQERLSISKPKENVSFDAAPSKCPVADKDYFDKISDWLSNRDISPIDVSQETQLQIGGVRSTVVLISCQASETRLRITEVKQKGAWKIKETAQLDD
jgi:hypothetical protein